MKRFLLLLYAVVLHYISDCQVPVQMTLQPGLSYTETFDSISTWANGFSAGAGANRFAAVAVGGTDAIPHPLRITTSSASFVTASTGGLQKDAVNGRLRMLVTGTTDNTSSLAFDFFMNLSGVNAGTLSFDWQTVFNGATTSNRAGTLKVYASTDGISFTEVTGASVTVTNYVPANGTVTVTLPTLLDNAPNARLRFYYYNAAGGTSGSRPVIALDNLTVTALGSPCSTPAASAAGLAFSNITPVAIEGSFAPANPAPDEYLVVATDVGSLSGYPADSTVYNPGDFLGDGTVVYRGAGTSFVASNLDPQTNYTFYVFSVNIYCNGATRHRTNDPLIGTAMTIPGPPCAPPAAQPANLQFSNVTNNSISSSFSSVSTASEYLVVSSLSPALTALPANGTTYHPGDSLGNDVIIYRSASTQFSAVGLDHSTTYYFHVFALNNYACSNGPAYLTAAPLTGQQATDVILPCQVPSGDAWQLVLQPGQNSIAGFFNPYNADGYLVVMSSSNTLSGLPQDGISYTPGSNIGGGTIISTGANYSFTATGLSNNTSYYFFIFAYNHFCLNGPLYRTSSYLSGDTSTTNSPYYKYFYGNLHAHSAYSDGNHDDTTLTPANNYAYAMNALCMDFLGISDHNHFTATNNPGFLLPKYHQGLTEANSFTAAHPGFLALYGMEWGTMTDGGHALVYGIDSLMGWETINSSPNYDIYVPKNDFTSSAGLFRKVNRFAANKAFVTLAHPTPSQFDGLLYQPHSRRADSAVVGIALENGPAFSANDNYSEPASSMSFLYYYEAMLSKGYHVAPMIDHDNHNTTFGRTAYTRTAVIAPSIGKSDFFEAVANRRFYATQSCDTRATINIYGKWMGSELTHPFAPAISIEAHDPSDPSAVPVIRLMYGVPGSNTPPAIIKTDTAYSLSYTDHSLPDSDTAFYYADISISGKRTITAPVWYTRKDTNVINNIAATFPLTNNLRIKNNPAKESLELELVTSRPADAVITLHSITGTTGYKMTRRLNAGITPINLDLSHLPAGVYIVTAHIGKENFREKFIHLK